MSLNNQECKIILGMVDRGDNRHDIAAWFGINQGRITEVERGVYGNFQAAPPEELPPKGPPGRKGRRLLGVATKAIGQIEDGNSAEALETLKSGIARYNRTE